MQEELFSGSALVEIQGDFVLRFLERKPTYAIYKILGFDEVILIHDYRQKGLQAIDDAITTNKVNNFPESFSGPSFITIYDSDTKQSIVIVLRDTVTLNPVHMLYIAIGLPEGIPIYRYVFGRVKQIDEQHYALVGLFQPEDEFPVESAPFAFCAA